jgi:predicted nucleotidyltransferase
VNWYNHEHLHSGIRYISPADRHDGRDRDILERRHAVYQQARAKNPRRWAKATRNWSRVEVVTLNPEKQKMAATASAEHGHNVGLAA